jgi:two-component system OmpR family response regulator
MACEEATMTEPPTGVRADRGELLVVDDEPFLRDAVAASLRFLGFTVATADTGTSALRLARRDPGTPASRPT